MRSIHTFPLALLLIVSLIVPGWSQTPKPANPPKDKSTSEDKSATSSPQSRSATTKSLLGPSDESNPDDDDTPPKLSASTVGSGAKQTSQKPKNDNNTSANKTVPAATNKSQQPTPASPTPAKTASAKQSTTDSEEAQTLRRVDKKSLTEHPSPTGGEEYLLRYKFTPGLVIASEVTHLAKTGTKIDSTQQDSHSRTVTQKTWRVTNVENGEMTFEYQIEHIDMSQQVGDGPELRYSSDSVEPAPPQFGHAADSVGRVISTVTIDEQGLIAARSDKTNPPNLGMGDITVPVPSAAIAVGATWEIPRELRIQRSDGTHKMIKFRELFKLEKVSAGVATISVRSEPLTSLTEPSEEAQVLQQLSNGTIRFDIDAGRMISKELAWERQVVGFSGSGSVMEYSARLDENVTSAESEKRTASKPRIAK